jgi:hypothetical protein
MYYPLAMTASALTQTESRNMLNKIVASTLLITAAGMACAQTSAPAGSGAYVGASYARVTVKNVVTSGNDVSPSTLGAVFGYDFNQHVALEARVAGGVGSDTLNLMGADFHVKFNRLAGVYAKWSQLSMTPCPSTACWVPPVARSRSAWAASQTPVPRAAPASVPV